MEIRKGSCCSCVWAKSFDEGMMCSKNGKVIYETNDEDYFDDETCDEHIEGVPAYYFNGG